MNTLSLTLTHNLLTHNLPASLHKGSRPFKQCYYTPQRKLKPFQANATKNKTNVPAHIKHHIKSEKYKKKISKVLVLDRTEPQTRQNEISYINCMTSKHIKTYS
ncbi:hypothetical protein Hanom_Chr00s000007g01615231 [Helianthus anomalus]